MKRKRERIYIIPTRYGVMYACGVLITLAAGAIYANNLVYLLCFFLLALFLVGMVQTNANLRGINLEKGSIPLVESEGMSSGMFWFRSENKEDHFQVLVEVKEKDVLHSSVAERLIANSLSPVRVPIKCKERGRRSVHKVQVSTVFPFGMFYAWKSFDVGIDYYCYPRPMGKKSLPTSLTIGEALSLELGASGDDFSEHKRFQPGQSQRHIDWKAFARGRPLLIKSFDDGQRDSFILDFNEIPGEQEKRLQQLSMWIHLCFEKQKAYALKLGSKTVSTNLGGEHKAECLKQISIYGRESA